MTTTTNNIITIIVIIKIKQLRISVASTIDTTKLKQIALTSNSMAEASEKRQ